MQARLGKKKLASIEFPNQLPSLINESACPIFNMIIPFVNFLLLFTVTGQTKLSEIASPQKAQLSISSLHCILFKAKAGAHPTRLASFITETGMY